MKDHRCPLPQTLQFYMGLKKLKKAEVQLVLYPRESRTKAPTKAPVEYPLFFKTSAKVMCFSSR
jgi:hypothetical protein